MVSVLKVVMYAFSPMDINQMLASFEFNSARGLFWIIAGISRLTFRYQVVLSLSSSFDLHDNFGDPNYHFRDFTIYDEPILE